MKTFKFCFVPFWNDLQFSTKTVVRIRLHVFWLTKPTHSMSLTYRASFFSSVLRMCQYIWFIYCEFEKIRTAKLNIKDCLLRCWSMLLSSVEISHIDYFCASSRLNIQRNCNASFKFHYVRHEVWIRSQLSVTIFRILHAIIMGNVLLKSTYSMYVLSNSHTQDCLVANTCNLSLILTSANDNLKMERLDLAKWLNS